MHRSVTPKTTQTILNCKGAHMRKADACILDIIFYHMSGRDMDHLVGWLSQGAVGRFSDYLASCRRASLDETQAIKH